MAPVIGRLALDNGSCGSIPGDLVAPPPQNIQMAHYKILNVFICRIIVYFQRGVQLFNGSAAHYHDPVRQKKGFLLVMGYV